MDPGSSDGLDVLLVGVDAACSPVLDRLSRREDIPTLRAILEEGVSGSLESQIPPWTASAWPSLYTGTNPGKHGVFGFLQFDGYDWDVANATHVQERPLWSLLSRHGLSSVVVNVPVTHPPQPFDGALVPGYTAPEDPQCHPEGLLDDLLEAIGTYRIYSEDGVDEHRAGETYRRFVRMRGEAFRYLANRFDPAFGFVQFQQTDTVFHEFPGRFDLVREVYREVDRQVAHILEECNPGTVVVVSDHGIGPCGAYEFRVNEFLRDAGFVESTVEGTGMPNWVSIRERRLRGSDSLEARGASLVTTVADAAARLGLTAQRAATVLEALGIADTVGRLLPDSAQRTAAAQVDFERSRAFVRDAVELGVRINLEGREPEGTVPRSEYEDVRAELVEALSTVTAPDGEPVYDDVAPREAYFVGPQVENAVDVVTVPAGFDRYLSAQLYGEQFGEPTEPYSHKLDGIIAARGEAVVDGADLGEPRLFDVAPTVLSMLGVPWDEWMDGSPLPFVEATESREYPPYDAQRSVPTDDDSVEQRLSDLGYIGGP